MALSTKTLSQTLHIEGSGEKFGLDGTRNSRHAIELPHHDDDAERITLGILLLFDCLSRLETLEPNVQNAKLFNQLFDLVTEPKTTKEVANKVSWPASSFHVAQG